MLLMLLLCMELNAQEACSTQMLKASYESVAESNGQESQKRFFAAFPSIQVRTLMCCLVIIPVWVTRLCMTVM